MQMQETINLAQNAYLEMYTPFLKLEYFTEESKDVVRDFICFLCGGISFDPKVDSCGHTFCNICINNFVKDHAFCPVNGNKDFKLNVIPSITKLVNRQSLFCKNKDKGCDFSGLIVNYAEHKCDWELVKCPNENCEYEVTRMELPDHVVVCEFRKVLCEDCVEYIVYNLMEKHSIKCLKKMIQCDLNCGLTVIREEMNKHVAEICDNTTLTCQYNKYGCLEKILRKNYKEHNFEYLPTHNSLFLTFFEDFQTIIVEKQKLMEKKMLGEFENVNQDKKKDKNLRNKTLLCKSKRNPDNSLEEEIKNDDEETKSVKTLEDEVIISSESGNDINSQSHNIQNDMIVFKETTYGIQVIRSDIIYTSKTAKPRFAFAYYASKNSSVFSWKIMVKKIVNWVGFGVCYKESIETNHYLINKPGNFLYAITSDGKIFENKEPVQEHFSLKMNDILEICYNTEQNTVMFKKEKLNITLYNVIAPKHGFLLVPCVVLNDKGDKISFL